MESRHVVTAATFAAYLKCPTKALLLARGEKPFDEFFADIERKISTAHSKTIRTFSPVKFCSLTRGRTKTTNAFVDSETSYYTTCSSGVIEGIDRPKKPEPGYRYVPILHSPWDKVRRSDSLIVSFCALAIEQATGTEVPPLGKIIFGDPERARTIKITDLLPKTRQIIAAIEQAININEPPPILLNKHCPVCDFQSRCRGIAIDRDDLSLLGTMSEKERTKCAETGITTITQLSYRYRPRRRKRVKSTHSRTNSSLKHDHRLKALAIKKSQIHVVGSPALSIEGTPVFIDVEGAPDRDFYYLIGLRYQMDSKAVERSLWADGPEDEFGIWDEFLHTLKKIDNPRLIHYGAYESRFLKLMQERWKPRDEDSEFVEQIVDRSTNLISSIYGKIYFPTYTNGLKEIARWLGFDWTWPQATGGGALLLRRLWELSRESRLQRQLVGYNIEDCRAVEIVADAIGLICGNDDQHDASKLKAVNVSVLEVGFQRTFGKFSSVLPEFEKINAAAYWDYQRSKVYVRTDKLIPQSIRKASKPINTVAVEKAILVDDRPALCPKCGSSKVWIAVGASNVIYDLKFTRRGIKRWAVRYHYNNFKCGACKAQMTPYAAGSKYGDNLRAYIAYLLIEMRLSHEKISDHLATVFDIPILGTMVNTVKQQIAQKYEPAYRAILAQIASGPVVHADETKGVVYGGGHYVWIFASFSSVAYVYSPTRDASTLNGALAGFDGVLVSDFYSGYESVPCRQQKCLIHLMRDINEDLLKQGMSRVLLNF
ncbi:TM0106 family RecB-like putative nuclease [Bradyrhizobium barranii subsp. apii]|uniref:TM0106 family RecB-like putative nuclease n=1 Tax=Bradyrhizobium barranii subsp. apii TaxID=2819348 RepID=A0A8T5VVR8_9BRAD|nr:TM0106 family RecB-like putative nuclease [Bradyrhizobium barranii]UPT88429.1 TM0106 family RecB-like putative nuclease [Bradyrhizobium barranii subsp. apii]